MKKILITIILFLLPLVIQSEEIPSSLQSFLQEHDLKYSDIKPYLAYQNFNYDDFFTIETLRKKNNYSYLEALNYFNNQETRASPLQNTTLVLVNKNFYLQKDYIPKDLIIANELGILCANENIKVSYIVIENYVRMIDELDLSSLYLFSGYRSYQKQESLYNYYKDDNYSAKPGFSEHQTGLAIDISYKNIGLIDEFSNTIAFKKLFDNAHKYGFILRYPKDKENITGYYFEPWHWRYVGKIHATKIKEENLVLEEYIYKNFEI